MKPENPYGIRITSNGTTQGTQVFDAKTGAKIPGVSRVTFIADAIVETVSLKLDAYVAELDVTVDASNDIREIPDDTKELIRLARKIDNMECMLRRIESRIRLEEES